MAETLDPNLTPSEVFECLRLLNEMLTVPFWIAGGVGVDLLVGRLTREHGDIDVCLDRRHRAAAFAGLTRARFRATRDLGWHTRWSRSARRIGELDVNFMTINEDGSTLLIVCPEDGIGKPGRYPGPPGALDTERYGGIDGIRCRVESAPSQIQFRRGYRTLFPTAGEDRKISHDLFFRSNMPNRDAGAALSCRFSVDYHAKHCWCTVAS